MATNTSTSLLRKRAFWAFLEFVQLHALLKWAAIHVAVELGPGQV